MKQAAIVAVILVLTGFAAARQDLSDVFYKAVHLQDVKGDLEAAIPLFERVVAESKDPSLAAKAQLRIGMCYEKLGLTRAQQAYQRVIDRYPGQSQEVALARARLAALTQSQGAETSGQAAAAIVTRQVWTNADGVFSNTPSPDGRYITYIDWESGNLAIRDLRAASSRLLTSEGTWREPAQVAYSSIWSPDGRQIAYHWEKGSEAQLRVMALDNRQSRLLFRDDSEGAWLGLQDWSPDGENILVWISRTGRPNQLALIPVKGGSPRVIKSFELGGVSAEGGLFSPDGRYILYGRTPGKVAAQDLFVLDVNGGSETPLIQHPADDRGAGWSPDGNWILFLSDRAGTLDFWAIRVADGTPQGSPLRVKRSVGRVAPLGFAEDGSFYYADVKVATGHLHGQDRLPDGEDPAACREGDRCRLKDRT